MYEMKERVRYSEVNEKKEVDISQVIKYFQDCSIFHSEDIGYGIDVLEKKGKVWFLCAWNIEMERYPMFGEEIIIKTWAYDRNDLYAYRNFVMIDRNGDYIAKANSIWFLVDIKTERPVKILDEDVVMYGLEERLHMEYKPRKIKLLKQKEQRDSFSIVTSHIDSNGHVNNSQYVVFAQEYIPNDCFVKSIRVDYKKAAKLHDIVVPYVAYSEQRCVVELCNVDGTPYVVIEFIIERA